MGKQTRLPHDEMRKYYLDGHTAKEVAEQFGTSREYASKICRGLRTGNQYTNGLYDREANAIRWINERASGFEYAGNFTGVDGFADIKCKRCGTVYRKSFVAIRHGKVQCGECASREREKRNILKRKRKETERKRARIEKRFKRIRNVAHQINTKQCPVCGGMFWSNREYCSDRCREQNKSMMKDGYRYLYPLDEVFKRDDGICYLCGGKCDWNDYEDRNGIRIYGNLYPSRDHVIPKSKGGENSWKNIRLAHRGCNSRKADIPLVENY